MRNAQTQDKKPEVYTLKTVTPPADSATTAIVFAEGYRPITVTMRPKGDGSWLADSNTAKPIYRDC